MAAPAVPHSLAGLGLQCHLNDWGSDPSTYANLYSWREGRVYKDRAPFCCKTAWPLADTTIHNSTIKHSSAFGKRGMEHPCARCPHHNQYILAGALTLWVRLDNNSTHV